MKHKKPPVTPSDESDTNPHATRAYWAMMGGTLDGGGEPPPEGELDFDGTAEPKESV